MKYTAVCRRAGDWWAISVPELPGVFTQARRLDQVDAMVRDAVALFLDVAPDSFGLDVKPELPTEAAKAVAARKALREAETAAEQATKSAAEALVKQGYTVRDVGSLLGVTAQRISQLTSTKKQPQSSTKKPKPAVKTYRGRSRKVAA